MKIYNKLVYDLKSGILIEKDFFEYDGSVIQCKGGGGSTIYSQDPEFNARMAAIPEEQMKMAREYFEYYKKGPGHWEEGVAKVSSAELHWEGHVFTQSGTDRQFYDEQGNPTGGFLDTEHGQVVDGNGKVLGSFNSGESYTGRGDDAEHLRGTEMMIFGNKVTVIQTAAGDAERVWVPDPGAVSYQQWEQEQLKANIELLPGQTAAAEAEARLAKLQAEYEAEQIPAKRVLLEQQMLTEYQNLKAAQELLSGQTALSKSKTLAERELLPGQTALSKGQTKMATEMLPQVQELAEQKMRTELLRSEGRAKLLPEYYSKVARGINVEDRMAKAKSDVQQEYAGAEGAMRREAGRMGVDPSSGRYASMRGAQLREQAAAVAGAGTKARRYAEEEQFKRIREAVQ